MHFKRSQKIGSPRRNGVPPRRDRTGTLALLIGLLLLAVFIAPVSGLVIVEYFYQPGCTYCEKTDPVIDTLRTEYGNRIALDRINVDNRAAIRLLMSYGVTEIPVVVINRNRVLSYAEITPERLDEEIRLAESGEYPVPADRKHILSGDPLAAVLFAFILGIMTGFSPCLLGSLVLLVAAAGGSAAAGQPEKFHPLVFGGGIITAYTALAAGILGAGVAFIPESGSRVVLYGIGGLVAIVVGLVQTGLFSIPGRITRHTSGLVSRFRTLPGIFLLGIIFAVLFAPCAIAPFLILIETILIDSTLAPVLMVPAFSLGILAPFIAFTVFRHSTQERLMKYTGIVQKAGGLLLVGFGVWLILSV
jgi:cytochrome c biogenesis protein CcdA/glutaredoxin